MEHASQLKLKHCRTVVASNSDPFLFRARCRKALLNTINLTQWMIVSLWNSCHRWFLDRIYTHIIAFEGESIAKMYIGNWSDYETMMMEKFGKDLQPHRVKYRQLKR